MFMISEIKIEIASVGHRETVEVEDRGCAQRSTCLGPVRRPVLEQLYIIYKYIFIIIPIHVNNIILILNQKKTFYLFIFPDKLDKLLVIPESKYTTGSGIIYSFYTGCPNKHGK